METVEKKFMPLIKSISGIRGTIGGESGDGLTPPDIVSLAAAFVATLKADYPRQSPRIVIGRDSRLSGIMVSQLVSGALLSQGVEVIDLGLASSPTVEIVVRQQSAQGGIIITASHNPAGWNALKLLDHNGEILTAESGEKVYRLASGNLTYSDEASLGHYFYSPELSEGHIRSVMGALFVDCEAIAGRGFRIVVDGINSVGGTAIPKLLRRLGVREVIELNCEPTGLFAHRPEPLAENLISLQERVVAEKADFGLAVDPDVDRLAFIAEDGRMISEEYTLVAVADYVLANFFEVEAAYPGQYEKTSSSNLSSTRALYDVVEKHGGRYEPAAVGETNVVSKMKQLRSFIGGEGNGGIIFPALHYGRDALIGAALYLSALARSGLKISEFQARLPQYSMVKDKLTLRPGLDIPALLDRIRKEESGRSGLIRVIDIDGIKFEWPGAWVHLRASNTEPIIRIYAEARRAEEARKLSDEMKEKISAYINQNVNK